MRLLTLLMATMVPAISSTAPAFASPKVGKVYAANGLRIAVIKDTAFGRKVYGPNRRRIATIKGR